MYFLKSQKKTVPLYRYWNSSTRDHFYTTNWKELKRGRYGYRCEGKACYVYQEDQDDDPTGNFPELEEQETPEATIHLQGLPTSFTRKF